MTLAPVHSDTVQSDPLQSSVEDRGVEIPRVGFGTYHLKGGSAQDLVEAAIELKYRHIDTAEKYRNEARVGTAISSCIEGGLVRREDLFVTTKLWPHRDQKTPQTMKTTIDSLKASLSRLRLDYVDLYLIHAPLCPEQRVDQWRGLVELRRQGLTRSIGFSNFGQGHLEEIESAGLPLPEVNQIELHPWSQKPELISFQADRQIASIAYSSLAPLAAWRARAGQWQNRTDAARR